jgi:hemolysin activation/secretion protein
MKKIILTLLTTSIIYAAGVFSIGSKNVGITVGSDNSFGNNYTVIGANVNYFVLDGISMGASYHAFLGGTPDIQQLTFPITYYLPLGNNSFRPYAGGFYTHTMIEEPYDNYDIYGGRIGISMPISQNSYISFGWVQEFSEEGNNINKRNYPEFSAGFSF